ncbi:hypothetical protein GCM10020331_010050 [Ectobacillus funiculus]
MSKGQNHLTAEDMQIIDSIAINNSHRQALIDWKLGKKLRWRNVERLQKKSSGTDNKVFLDEWEQEEKARRKEEEK